MPKAFVETLFFCFCGRRRLSEGGSKLHTKECGPLGELVLENTWPMLESNTFCS